MLNINAIIQQVWQSPRLRWIWSISEYNPNGIPTRSMENVKWYSPSQVLTAKHVPYPQLSAPVWSTALNSEANMSNINTLKLITIHTFFHYLLKYNDSKTPDTTLCSVICIEKSLFYITYRQHYSLFTNDMQRFLGSIFAAGCCSLMVVSPLVLEGLKHKSN